MCARYFVNGIGVDRNSRLIRPMEQDGAQSAWLWLCLENGHLDSTLQNFPPAAWNKHVLHFQNHDQR